jgi:hypothetical protein
MKYAAEMGPVAMTYTPSFNWFRHSEVIKGDTKPGWGGGKITELKSPLFPFL